MTTTSKNACTAVDRRNGADIATEARDGNPRSLFRPPMDILEFADHYEIHLDLPGTDPGAINAFVENGVLTIQAGVACRHPASASFLLNEYGVGNYHRQIRLGEDIATDEVSANYADGVLRVVLPKVPERRPRRITIVSE